MIMKKYLFASLMMALAVTTFANVTPAWAEVLSVQVGKARIIQLKQMPVVVMVGDPGIADVVIERNKQIFLVGLQPGETNLFILDDAGNKIMNVDLVVTQLTSRHVTVDRGTSTATLSCNPRCSPVPTPSSVGAGQGSSVGEEEEEEVTAAAPAPVASQGAAPAGSTQNSGTVQSQ